ncbi:uncharacterized protein LOC119728059 [Patiria miniata]|uniref:Uncharacterized protein n=1 Tax=Patiria miniata TaxID=46514 RepID=A0A913ZWZ0_PATMI|nr:uncharacterized protein LOC119728059 [Patiria miniata]
MDIWHKVIYVAASFEYLDDVSGTWQVSKKAKKPKEVAYKRLLEYYNTQTKPCLEVGILHFQNFKFKEAVEQLIKLIDTEADLKIPWYLAQTYLKMGLQEEQQALSKNLRPEKAKEIFKKAHDKVLGAMKFGLKQRESRKLLAEVALAIAHNELQLLVGLQSQDITTADHEAQQMPSTSTALRTQSRHTTAVDEGAQQMSSTSDLSGSQSQNTVEVDEGAQQMSSTSSVSGTQGQDTIPLESQCIMSYREAVRCGSLVASLELLRLVQKDSLEVTSRWMFLQILAEIDVSCSLRGTDLLHQEEEPLSFEKGLSSRDRDKDASALNCKTIKRGILAILHQQPFFRQAWREHFNMEREILRDRFENNKGELELDGRQEETKETFSDEIVYAATDCYEKLRPLLDRIFVRFGVEELGIEEIKGQYFPLILDEENATKTQDKLRSKLMETFGIDMEKNYPKLYQQLLKTQPGCSSQNGFLKTFCTTVNKIKHSDVDLNDILETSKDPVTLARQCTDKVEEICRFFFDTMTEARDLRKKVEQLEDDIRHGEHEKAGELLEVLSSNEGFVFRIGSTCTWKLLEPHGGQSATQPPMPAVTFPFCDLHPGVDRVDQWKGKVKKHLNKELNKVGIPGSVQNNKELLETVMQAQPCTDEKNYQFIAMEEFLKQCNEGGAIPDTVRIKPDNQEEKTFQVLDLTRWLTDNSERIAIKIEAVKVAGQ